jgi:transcriptional regulator with XRE-family HTH domain
MNKEALRKTRRSKEVTQVKLAELSGISLATVNRAEKTGNVRLITMLKLFKTLDKIS